jgi:predicted nucleic acid-binding protein
MIVSDTGPLAVLFKARLLFILKELHEEVLVPRAVERELRRKPEGADIFRDNIWINATEVENIELVKALMLVVDEGEAEAIALALHSSARILIDEKRGRNAATALGLEIRGTLGLFVEAKNKSIIRSVKDCIGELLEVGYYLDYVLIEEVLRKADEI